MKLGTDVCYVTRAGKPRVAKIVNLNDDGTVNLCVFRANSSEDQGAEATVFIADVKQDAKHGPGTFHEL